MEQGWADSRVASQMLRTAARHYAKKSVVSTLRRLPESIQLRLTCQLGVLLGDRAGEAIRVLLARLPAADRALLLQEAAGDLDKCGIETIAPILERLPGNERAVLLQRLAAGLDAQAADVLRPVFARLSRAENVSIFQELVPILDVSAVEACGRNGRLTGYLQDEGIFLPYLRDRSWFWNAVEIINAIFAGRRRGTFLDIGANIGAVVVPIARSNPSVDCIAFEPESNNFVALTHNIARNGVSKNTKAYETALGEADGPVTFELADANFGDHRVRKSASSGTPMFNEEVRATVQVGSRRLDGVLALHELARPIVAKIDVQGAELMVLAGGETILREAELLVVEYWPYGMRRLGSDPMEFLRAFSGIFPFAARVAEQPIARSDFVPFAAMRAELEAFAEKRSTMHLNLALTRRPIAELVGVP